MTRAEAEERAGRLQEEHDDRATHRFLAHPRTGNERRMPGLPGGL